MQKPSISCIMPTYNRHPMMFDSIQMFLNQTLHNFLRMELIIIDDSPQKVNSYTFPKNVKYFHYKKKMKIGKKRNIAVCKSSGDIICFWDDDDFHMPDRLYDQYINLTNSKCLLHTYNNCIYYYSEKNKLIKTKKKLHDILWYKSYLGCTLMYYKNINIKFRNINISEDSSFIKDIIKKYSEKKLCKTNNKYYFIYHVHSQNISETAPIIK